MLFWFLWCKITKNNETCKRNQRFFRKINTKQPRKHFKCFLQKSIIVSLFAMRKRINYLPINKKDGVSHPTLLSQNVSSIVHGNGRFNLPMPSGTLYPYLWGISAHREGHSVTTSFVETHYHVTCYKTLSPCHNGRSRQRSVWASATLTSLKRWSNPQAILTTRS